MRLLRRPDFWIGLLLSLAMAAGSWRHWLPFDLNEAFGFVTGAACVYLVVLENVWNFPVGIANNVFLLVLFLETRLYGDAGLQIVFLLLGFHGWYEWVYGGENRTALKVSHAPTATLGAAVVGVGIGTAALTAILRSIKGAVPVLDAFTTALSLAAQLLLNRKQIENWYFWILADVIYIYVYLVKGLLLIALLYALFLCMCVVGYVQWRSAYRLSVEGLSSPLRATEAVDSDGESVRG